ncbi:cation-translocating P-type ATPase [Halorientalis brevis]|uniref:Cation-translocating P-type ATPase n=1 Tax=Halorientalis brevis TaxID=1126241 RepID=A0ABD6CEI5_9EURY|nr:cation-transporting P-type ATPase [Halorientalis brevis]
MGWHTESVDEIQAELETDDAGLSSEEARRRLDEYGPNEIESGETVSPLAVFVSQFQDALVYLLVVAALLAVGVGFLPGQDPEYVDAGLILLILLANGVFGFVQDYRAQRSIEALRELASPDATVIRDGERRIVDAREVVPGDRIVVEQGDAIPADARVVEANGLETNESALTGESATVGKDPEVLPEDTPLAERENMVFMNTTAVRGRGQAVVIETGMDTEVGEIATQLGETEETETTFQSEIDRLGKQIGVGVVALIGLVALIQFLLTGTDPITVLLVAVTLAVAAVPEGLPAVVTFTLALGSRTLLDKNALVRRLPVVESLGSVDVILTDKTGTLTENRMIVTRAYADDAVFETAATDGGRAFQEEATGSALEAVLRCGAVCNNTEPAPADADEDYHGDPTEIAVFEAAKRAGVDADADRLREIPFSSERRRMTVVVDEDEPTAYMKGAPGKVLEHCDRLLDDGEVVPLTDERRAAILEQTEQFAGDALRVLGFARKSVADTDAPDDEIESGLVFLGLQGMIDPPRGEVADAVADCRRAGIRVIMATGDNLATASAIGEQVGFDPDGAMTGHEFASLSEDEQTDTVEDVEVFARAEPRHKVSILSALRENGHDVAMTGDGVNDAPALQGADVGIAMGQRGTDVAKQASDMILQDDNFVTIRDAVEAGRGIFDNVRTFVNYLLSANAGEVLVVFFGVLLGGLLFPDLFAGSEAVGLVLTPVMLLWVNLVTDGLPALALGADPTAPNVMDRPPRGRGEPIIDQRVLASVLGIGIVMTIVGLSLFFARLSATGSLVRAQTTLFTFLVLIELARIQLIRRRYGKSLRSNPWLVGAVVLTLALQLLVLYTPLAGLFDVVPLPLDEWLWLAGAFAAFVVLNYLLVLALDRLLPAIRAGER